MASGFSIFPPGFPHGIYKMLNNGQKVKKKKKNYDFAAIVCCVSVDNYDLYGTTGSEQVFLTEL